MGWKDGIVLILGALVFAAIGGVLFYNIHKLKAEAEADMRKREEEERRRKEREGK